ncbi:hypothetical protein KPH14_012234 [Odynerus spinipes]|uniref:SAP domain-containing protein n=1 Tax=Odynerus spinipes TaxID=1348599 RepID=A0AAD9REQ9_9HYME|nr:hypothetical protein KPH14_012234 [Odynerus spinipes]
MSSPDKAVTANSFRVEQLKAKLESMKLSTKGSKAELISRLMSQDPSGGWISDLEKSLHQQSDVCAEEGASSIPEPRVAQNAHELDLLRRERDLMDCELQLMRREVEFLRGAQGSHDPQEILRTEPMRRTRKCGTYEIWEKQARDGDGMKVLICSRLRGRAVEWFHSKAEFIEMSFEGILEEMRKMYGQRVSRVTRKKEFEARIRKKGETFSEYVHDKAFEKITLRSGGPSTGRKMQQNTDSTQKTESNPKQESKNTVRSVKSATGRGRSSSEYSSSSEVSSRLGSRSESRSRSDSRGRKRSRDKSPEKIGEASTDANSALPANADTSQEHANITVDTPKNPESPPKQGIDEKALEILGKRLTIDKAVGPPICEELVSRWSEILAVGLPKEDRAALLLKYGTPSNCPAVNPPKLNPEVKVSLTEPVTNRDARLVAKQDKMTACISVLGALLSKLLCG